MTKALQPATKDASNIVTEIGDGFIHTDKNVINYDSPYQGLKTQIA